MADRDYTIVAPDGRELTITGPDNATPAQLRAAAEKAFAAPKQRDHAADRSEMIKREVTAFFSPLRGVKDVVDTGAELLAKGYDKVTGADKNVTGLVTGQPQGEYARVKAMNDAAKREFEETTKGSLVAGIGRLIGNILATAPVGGVLAAPFKTVAPRLASSLATSGMATGAPVATNMLGRATDLGIRMAGGAATGGASAGLIDPEFAETGATIGALLPPAAKVVGASTSAAAKALRGGGASPEVAKLADRAQQLGINIPADRLVNSKPLDAVASGLNYVPFSGRAATEARMNEQLNRAASKLMGQDTPNINKAIRDASAKLGAEFDSTLKSNGVVFDKQLLDEAASVFNTAERELGSDALKPIAAQLDELVRKGAAGVIDGQAAYNIKRTLDRIGSSNTPTAYHALELKRVLMDALNRSLGPDGAKAFAKTRQQYGNMLAFEKLAKNGVEGEISVARLANLKNINNEPLQELADIAAQFVKPREGQHGAMQRALVGLGAGATGGVPGVVGLTVGGRATNMLLNSRPAKDFMLKGPPTVNALALDPVQRLLYQVAPPLGSSR